MGWRGLRREGIHMDLTSAPLERWRHTSGMTFCNRARTAEGVEWDPAPPTSQLWKQNFISTPWGGCKIGDYKAFEVRNYSLGLIIGLRTTGQGWRKGGVPGLGVGSQIFALKCWWKRGNSAVIAPLPWFWVTHPGPYTPKPWALMCCSCHLFFSSTHGEGGGCRD